MNIDCTNIVNFYTELDRFCNNLKDCSICNFKNYCSKTHSLSGLTPSEFNEMIEKIQNFSDHNPRKTYVDDFREKYPDADWNVVTLYLCPLAFGYDIDEDCDNCSDYCHKCIKECWNLTIPESEKY